MDGAAGDQAPRPYLAREARRAMLLDHARAIVALDGASALSMRTLAARAGIAHGSVQHAFGSKAELVRSLLEHEARAVLERVWQRIRPGASVTLGDLVALALDAYADDLERHPEQHAALAALERAARASPALRSALVAERDALRVAVGDLLAGWALRRDEAPPDDADAIVEAVLVAIDGLTQWWLATGFDARRPRVVRMLAGGFGANP